MDEQWMRQLQQVLDWLQHNLTRLLPVVIVVGGALYLASGIYMVTPGYLGVVRTFGKETARAEPGLNYRFPYPFQQVNIVSTEEIRRIEVGFRGTRRVPEESLMLTGDENIVEAQMVVQYRVADPSKYLFRIRDAETALLAATEVALRSTVGGMTIDQVMIEERARVQENTREFVQRLMDSYESGLSITEVRLQAADPPDAVRDAFHDVVRAREDRERLINVARGYQADLLPRARGQAQQQIFAAEAYKQERVLRAQGQAARFLSVLAEYEQAKDVTRQRLYLETVERILPGIDKVVLDEEAGQRMMPVLSLGGGLPALPAPAGAAAPSQSTPIPAFGR
jgi:modulator of FtsH protease HflK